MPRIRMTLAAAIAAATLALGACEAANAPETVGGDNAAGPATGTYGGLGPDTPVTNTPAATPGQTAGDPARNDPADDACGASKVAAFVSQTATPAVRDRVAAEVGHGTIRWIGPDTAVTEDYSIQRLNVTLDANDVITGAWCG